MAILWPTLKRLDGPLIIQCTCGYSVTWPRELAIKRLGEHATPPQVRGKLKCAACGARGPGKISIDGRMR